MAFTSFLLCLGDSFLSEGCASVRTAACDVDSEASSVLMPFPFLLLLLHKQAEDNEAHLLWFCIFKIQSSSSPPIKKHPTNTTMATEFTKCDAGFKKPGCFCVLLAITACLNRLHKCITSPFASLNNVEVEAPIQDVGCAPVWLRSVQVGKTGRGYGQGQVHEGFQCHTCVVT